MAAGHTAGWKGRGKRSNGWSTLRLDSSVKCGGNEASCLFMPGAGMAKSGKPARRLGVWRARYGGSGAVPIREMGPVSLPTPLSPSRGVDPGIDDLAPGVSSLLPQGRERSCRPALAPASGFVRRWSVRFEPGVRACRSGSPRDYRDRPFAGPAPRSDRPAEAGIGRSAIPARALCRPKSTIPPGRSGSGAYSASKSGSLPVPRKAGMSGRCHPVGFRRTLPSGSKGLDKAVRYSSVTSSIGKLLFPSTPSSCARNAIRSIWASPTYPLSPDFAVDKSG